MTIEVNPEDDFHVVINGNVVALSLDALSAAYESDVVEDESLIWQPGLGEWMRLDRVLYELEQAEPVAPAPPMADTQYFVLVAPEQVREMSLDLLAEAYESELVDESTLVWQTGFSEWIPLGFLLADEEATEHVSLAPSLAPSAGYARPAPAPLESAQAWAAPSVAPLALSVPPAPKPASPWFKRSLLAAMALGGLFVGHQFGMSHALASELDAGSAGSHWSERIGEPSPSTPHGVERWLRRMQDQYGLAELSETEPVPVKSATAGSVEASEDSTSAAADSDEAEPPEDGAKSSGDAEPTGGDGQDAAPAADQARSRTNAEGSNEAQSSTEADAFGAALGTRPKPQPTPRAKPRAPRRAPSSPNLPTTGDPNDPMNGTL